MNMRDEVVVILAAIVTGGFVLGFMRQNGVVYRTR